MLGTDVAYYHPALRPLMDAISAHLDPEGGLMLVAGQANRGQQMQLRKNIRDGCYNQLTDAREPPWPGASTMLLYELAQRPWESVGVGNEEGRGGRRRGREAYRARQAARKRALSSRSPRLCMQLRVRRNSSS